MKKKKAIILWVGDKPRLYCSHESGKSWHVNNGNWELLLDGLNGTVVYTGAKVTFDRKTIAPKGGDYNDVMSKATLEDEIVQE